MTLDQMLMLLVKAGATPLSAAKAAVILDQGGSVKAAGEVIEFAPLPVFEAELLVAEARRAVALIRVEVAHDS